MKRIFTDACKTITKKDAGGLYGWQVMVLRAVFGVILILLVGCTYQVRESSSGDSMIKLVDIRTVGEEITLPDGTKVLSIDGKTRFNIKINAKNLIDSPYTKTKCAYYRANAVEKTKGGEVGLETLLTDENSQEVLVEFGNITARAYNIQTDVDDQGDFVYSVKPIETKVENKIYREYCLIPGKNYSLQIKLFRKDTEADNSYKIYTIYQFYFSDQTYDSKNGKFLE